MSLSEQMEFKTLIQYLSAIALALFYLIYMPWTYLSSDVAGMGVGLEYLYYFSLVLGLLFPMYYAIGKDKMAWLCLGLALMVNSVLWMLLDATQAVAAVLVLIVGFLFFIGTFLEDRMSNWDLIKNVFHFLQPLLFPKDRAVFRHSLLKFVPQHRNAFLSTTHLHRPSLSRLRMYQYWLHI